MAALDGPYGGIFPYINAAINWEHPLAASLVFFAVPAPYGYFDLVRRQPMPHQPESGSPTSAQRVSRIQLFGETPLNMAAWSYGNGNTNPFGAYARTPDSQPSYNTTSMTVAASCWSFPYGGGYGGTLNRFINATCGTDANGFLAATCSNTANGSIGGNSGTGGVSSDLTNMNNIQTTHCVLASFDGTTLTAQRDNAMSSTANESARAPLANIDRITIGDPTNSSGRPIFWGAAWSVALSATLRNLVTAPAGAVSRNPNFGAIPAGLLIRRRQVIHAG